MDNNIFNINFGELPINYIERLSETKTIIETFTSNYPETKTYIITGPRGTGKTVLLSNIKKELTKLNNWITIDINPYEKMIDQIASKIYEKGKMKKLFLKSEFNFSFNGLSITLKGENPIVSSSSLVEVMLDYLKKKNIKVLLCVDDIFLNDEMKSFIYSYQSFLREGYGTYLLMSGLFENINKLEEEKGLTFLSRASKIVLEPLPLRNISNIYSNIFNVSTDDSVKLAKLTNGYAYAFQLLGSLLVKSNKNKIDNDLITKYDSTLQDNVYYFIYDKIPNKEKEFLLALAKSKNGSAKEIIELMNTNNSAFQVYRLKLTKKGLINSKRQGYVSFILPRFREFILLQNMLEEIEF